MANKELMVDDDVVAIVRRIHDYLERAKKSRNSYEIREDGILVKFPMEFVTEGLIPLAGLMRGDNGVRSKFDKDGNDAGEHRLYETVVGILGECACVVASSEIPLQEDTGEFIVDLKVYSSLSSDSCYSCDLNDSVTVKTCGRWVEKKVCKGGHPPTSWIAAEHDVIRMCPEGKRIILCKWVADNEILIMGWVNAVDVVDLWSPTLKKAIRKEALYYHRYDDNFVNAGDSATSIEGSIVDIINPITRRGPS